MVAITTPQGEDSSQSSFFGMIYGELIPTDHLQRKLAAAVDLSFVSETVSDCCCPDNGRPAWEPRSFTNYSIKSSDRRLPPGSDAILGNGGSIFAHCSSVNKGRFRAIGNHL